MGIGGRLSESLSLEADAVNCLIDAVTYVVAYIVEDIKVKNADDGLSYETLFWMEVYVPAISMLILLGFMAYVVYDALTIIIHPPSYKVDVLYILVFSSINLVVALTCLTFMLIGNEDDPMSDKIVIEVSTGTSQFGEESPLLHSELGILKSVDDLMRAKDDTFKSTVSHLVTESSCEDGTYLLKQEVGGKNYNMISAILHLAADLLIAVSELLAALISLIFRVDPDLCDACAALVGASVVVLISFYVLFELYLVYERLNCSRLDEKLGRLISESADETLSD